MKILIPYKYAPGPELMYCLRSIEMYVPDPEIVIIGDKTPYKTKHIYTRHPEIKYKERNVFEKMLMMDSDFVLFNDDIFLLEPLKVEYHYSGTILQQRDNYHTTNNFRSILQNTVNLYGDIPNYFRHGPIFIEREKLESVEKLDWNLPWGFCSKSVYCHINNIKGTEYPDLKIRVPSQTTAIVNSIQGRPYFSTGDHAVNLPMVKVLETLYPKKSRFE